jgi:hypothetical protein
VLQPEAFSIDLQRYQPALSVPRQGGSVGQVIIKLTAILDVVRAGKSIAENTTDSAAPNQRASPEMIARSQTPPLEYEAWTTFKQGLWRLPELDWNKKHLPPPTSLKSLKVARRRAEALNRLYETDQANEGHVTWITQNEIEFLPMVKATARVIGAERNHVGGGEWQATELADLQLINRILSIYTQIYQESKSKLLRSRVAETQQVLGNYRRTLKRRSCGVKGAGITSVKHWSHPIIPVRHGTPTSRLAQGYENTVYRIVTVASLIITPSLLFKWTDYWRFIYPFYYNYHTRKRRSKIQQK